MYIFNFETMRAFYEVYKSAEFSNNYSFVRKLVENGVSENDASIVWQSFDMMEEVYLEKLKRNFKVMKIKYKCKVCGKIGGGRMPVGGDGTFHYPRIHRTKGTKEFCNGSFDEAIEIYQEE